MPEHAEYGSGAPEDFFPERKLEFLSPRNEVFRELKQKQEQDDQSFNRKWKMKPILYSEGGAEPEELAEIGGILFVILNIYNILIRINSFLSIYSSMF